MRSFNSFNGNKVHTKNCFLLLLVCLLAYWPLTFGVFSVKNDAIHYFLPYRFNISEALRNGEWPFWSPYTYLGNPVYGDMQSGAWNPIVWIFSMIGRYDLTLFHYENLLYLFLGGVGMYKLTNRFVKDPSTALLIGVSYMLSGFMLGGQLINWLASAAFIPFVFLYYLRTLKLTHYGNAVKTGIALFFLLTAGYPSFFIITCYLLIGLFLVKLFDKYKAKVQDKQWKTFLFNHLLLAAVFLGLSAPAIISYYDLLPYYQRGDGANYADTIQNSFEAKHLLSFLFPSTIKTEHLISSTDITCRNIYAGIFIIPILAAFPPKLNRRNILLIGLALFVFLFSLGDATPIRKICYQFIPLMDSFRHPSQMRLFIILSLLLLVAPGLKKILNNEPDTSSLNRLKRINWGFTALIVIVTISTFFASEITGYIKQFSFSAEAIKNIISRLTTPDVIFINGMIQLFFMTCLLWWLKKEKKSISFFSILWILNVFIMAQLVLPISFVGSTKPKTINAFIHASPKGFPVKGLENTIAANSSDAFDQFEKTGLSFFYNKKIGISKVMNSPAFLKQQEDFISDHFLYNYVSALPVAYMADAATHLKDSSIVPLTPFKYVFAETPLTIKANADSTNTAVITKLSADHFEIETNSSADAYLVLTQNYHNYWKATADGNPVKITRVNTAFMGIPVSPGKHEIVFRFYPSNTIKAMAVQIVTVLVLIFFAVLSWVRRKK